MIPVSIQKNDYLWNKNGSLSQIIQSMWIEFNFD